MKTIPVLLAASTASVLFICALLGPLPVRAQEEIYKWVDDEGITHFSARPPEGVEYERINTLRDRRETVTPQTVGDTEDGLEDTADSMLPALPEVDVQQPDPELVAERCQQARSNLQWLTQRVRINRENDEGEVERISEEERQRLISEAQAFIEEWC
jgi:hypothetical protein